VVKPCWIQFLNRPAQVEENLAKTTPADSLMPDARLAQR
jgi:hypothetical protein